MINWKVRIKNKNFWLALIPAVLLLIQSVAEVFGYTLADAGLAGKLSVVVEQVFLLLAILGIVNDPTTKGFGDSELALSYDEPRVHHADDYTD